MTGHAPALAAARVELTELIQMIRAGSPPALVLVRLLGLTSMLNNHALRETAELLRKAPK